MKTIRITIPEKQAETFREIAKRKKKTPQAVAREALLSYAEDYDWEKAGALGRRIAQRLGIRTEDDVTKVFD